METLYCICCTYSHTLICMCANHAIYCKLYAVLAPFYFFNVDNVVYVDISQYNYQVSHSQEKRIIAIIHNDDIMYSNKHHVSLITQKSTTQLSVTSTWINKASVWVYSEYSNYYTPVALNNNNTTQLSYYYLSVACHFRNGRIFTIGDIIGKSRLC